MILLLIHNRFVQFLIILASFVVAELVNVGLDKIWRKSRLRNVAIVGCFVFAAMWFLP
jgi:hypothetical protein